MNPWEILGLEPGADRAAIKAAYFEKIKVHSPDKDPEKFKEIRAAYDSLLAMAASGAGAAGETLRPVTIVAETYPRPEQVLRELPDPTGELSIEQLIRLTL